MKHVYCVILFLMTSSLLAWTLESLPSLSVSPFPDVEVSTNISLRINSDAAQIFDLRLMAVCTPSNAFQVAFGRDTNEDRVLSLDETDVVYGWRGGRWFVEDVQNWSRREALADADGAVRMLTINSETRSDSTLRKLQVTCGGDSLIEALALTYSDCFFSPDWNLMRVTRRGKPLNADNIYLSIRNKGSLLYIR